MGRLRGVRFVTLSLIGIIMFFIPVYRGMIPVAVLINGIKLLFGSHLDLVVVLSSVALAVELAAGKLFKIPRWSRYFEGEKIRCVFWAASVVIVILKLLKIPIPFLIHPKIGGTILNLGSTVFLTIAVAGSLVIFIIRSGVVEFFAVIMEPIIRPLFRLPGEAAVNILSSFVSSASVGVYFTEQYYIGKRYTVRQACSVVSSFSVVSVGYIGIIASLSEVGEQYGLLIVCSFILVLIMAAVMVRIPPLSRLPECFIDGTEPMEEPKRMGVKARFLKAWESGIEKSSEFTWESLVKNTLLAFQFAQKIVGVMIPTVLMVLILVYYTPLFKWLGYPLIPILHLLQIPDAQLAAPSVLIGIVEVSLPAILVGGCGAAVQTRFFVALLSIVQIIFFSEAGNAILGSKIPLNALDLVKIFLIRTAVALPLAALITHIIY